MLPLKRKTVLLILFTDSFSFFQNTKLFVPEEEGGAGSKLRLGGDEVVSAE